MDTLFLFIELFIGKSTLPHLFWVMPTVLTISLITCLSWILFNRKKKHKNSSIAEVAGFIHECAGVFLRRQYKLIFSIIFCLSGLMFLGSFLDHFNHFFGLVIFSSGIWAGLIGYHTLSFSIDLTTRIVRRTQKDFKRGTQLLLSSGCMLVIICVTVTLADISLWFWGLNWVFDHNVLNLSRSIIQKIGFFISWTPSVITQPDFIHFKFEEIAVILICYAIGASIQALISTSSGGILRQATGMATGHAIPSLPEDDIRNPGVLGDIVGRHIAGISGHLSGLFQLLAACLAFGAYLGAYLLESSPVVLGIKFVMFPLIVLGISLLTLLVGTACTFFWQGLDSQATDKSMIKAQWLVGGLNSLGLLGITYLSDFPLGFGFAAIVGVIISTCVSITYGSFTKSSGKMVESLTQTDSAGFTLLKGIELGFKTALIPMFGGLLAFGTAYVLGDGLQSLSSGMYAVNLCATAIIGNALLLFGFSCAQPLASTSLSLTRMLQDEETTPKFLELKTLTTSAKATSQALLGVALILIVTTSVTVILISIKHWIHKLAGADGIAIGNTFFCNHPLVGHPSAVLIPSTHIFDLADMLGVTMVNPQFIIGLIFGIFTVIGVAFTCLKKSNQLSATLMHNMRKEFTENPNIGEGTELAQYHEHIQVATQASEKAALPLFMMACFSALFSSIFFGISGSLGHIFGMLTCITILNMTLGNSVALWGNAYALIQSKKETIEGHLPSSLKMLSYVSVLFPECILPVLNTVMILVVNLAVLFGLLSLKFGHILVL